jgi:DNA-binding CsgD family transcriptional regulator
MDELEHALALTGGIYDAALDPALWPEALHGVAGFVGGVAAALVSEDVVARKGGFHFTWGVDPALVQTYLDKYINLNPVLVPIMLLKVGEVRSASTILPTDKFRTTRFYKEYAGPAGHGDNTVAMIEKRGSVITFLATPHADADSPVDAGPRRRMELIAPHVRRAVAIGNIIEMHRVDADALAEAVDAIATGVFLVREDGYVVRANARGRAMLAEAEMICLDRGAIGACPPGPSRRALREAIAGAAAGSLIVRPRGVAVPLLDRGGERYVAHVLPLTTGNRGKAGIAAYAQAAVFVHKAEMGGLLPLEAISRQFGLTNAELRVLVAVIEAGGGVPDIASVLGLSEPTVRTHLRRLFEKTGARRQADLVRIAGGYSSPLLGPHRG